MDWQGAQSKMILSPASGDTIPAEIGQAVAAHLLLMRGWLLDGEVARWAGAASSTSAAARRCRRKRPLAIPYFTLRDCIEMIQYFTYINRVVRLCAVVA